MRLRTAMTTLQGALPDATQEQLLAYEDDCAICKVRYARFIDLQIVKALMRLKANVIHVALYD